MTHRQHKTDKDYSLWLRLIAAALLLAGLVHLSGCGGDSGGPAGGGDNLVGPAGGTVAGTGSASVVIPPGALIAATEITVAGVSDAYMLPDGTQPCIPFLGGAEFGPTGTEFTTPVTISFPLDPPLAPGTPVNLLVWDDVAQAWVDEGFPVTLALDGASLTAEVTHFSIFGCLGNVFGNFHSDFGDGSTAAAALSNYVSWFRANVTDMARKGLFNDDCHEVKGLMFDASWEVHHYPDGPDYVAAPPQIMEGEVTATQVTFQDKLELSVAGVLFKKYILAVDVYLECCPPEVDVVASPSSIGTGATSQITATVMCDDEAMAGHEVTFAAMGGLGTMNPATAGVNAAGTATSTFTAGDSEGIESTRAHLSTCSGSENPDGAAQVEITAGDWTAVMNIAWLHDIGSGPLIRFVDNMQINLNLTRDEGVVTGSGTGSHGVSTITEGNCTQTSVVAPGFAVTASGVITDGTLELEIIPTTNILELIVTCVWNENPVAIPYPIYGNLEASLLTDQISISIPWTDGAGADGSGSYSGGSVDMPITWNWNMTLSGQSQ
ncbi:MAG: hypothetical protein GY835_25380 [bacterium]|nr:hypothetical protein [bacterium]